MTTYSQYPKGYPKREYRVVPAGSRWAIESDTWHTTTSHNGWTRGDERYESEDAAAEQVAFYRRQQNRSWK